MKIKNIQTTFLSFILGLFSIYVGPLRAELIVDHTAVAGFDQIPGEWITAAKAQFRIGYGHTSHGSQITTGMGMVRDNVDATLFGYTSAFYAGDLSSSIAYDLGNPNSSGWYTGTREYLAGGGSNRNVIMGSWFGQGDKVSSGIYTAAVNLGDKKFKKKVAAVR